METKNEGGLLAQAVFTPGPYERSHGDFVYALGTDREGRAVNRMFASVHAGWAGGKRTSQAELNATAALFQGSPDLYEALRPFAALGAEIAPSVPDGKPLYGFGGSPAITAGDVRRAAVALAKAEGRSDPKGPPGPPAAASPQETP